MQERDIFVANREWLIRLKVALGTLGLFLLATPLLAAAGPEIGGVLGKRVKAQVQPIYPDLARRMHVQGVVKVEVTVSSNGKIKSTKVLGGHPLLVGASEDAVKKWKFEPAAEETTGVVEFRFQSDDQ